MLRSDIGLIHIKRIQSSAGLNLTEPAILLCLNQMPEDGMLLSIRAREFRS